MVAETIPSKRQTVIGLSITNLTNGFLTVSILLDDDTRMTGYYLKDALLAFRNKFKSCDPTGEKLVLGTNNKLKVQCNVDDAVDVIVSFVETT